MNKCDILNQELLTNNGFVYRKRGWYRCTEDFLQIINFQKSNWGNQYYINIGEKCLSRLNAGSIIYPPERLFHLRGRVEDLGELRRLQISRIKRMGDARLIRLIREIRSSITTELPTVKSVVT